MKVCVEYGSTVTELGSIVVKAFPVIISALCRLTTAVAGRSNELARVLEARGVRDGTSAPDT
jgi:hypothetical protein